MGRGDFAIGNDSVNPFTPPRQMAAHAASIVVLLELIQRARKEPQRAVEVGVWQSATSRWLLTAMPYLELALVDPLECGGEGTFWRDSFAGAPPEQIQRNVELVEQTVKDFSPRATWYREMSVDAAARFADDSQDLIFIDAGHLYENVRDDIAAWKSKVRPGGYLSFHDWKPSGKYGKNVGRAVREFLKETGYKLTVWPGKVAAVRIPPYERMEPICPNCGVANVPEARLCVDHCEQFCRSCSKVFGYHLNPANEYHCFGIDMADWEPWTTTA